MDVSRVFGGAVFPTYERLDRKAGNTSRIATVPIGESNVGVREVGETKCPRLPLNSFCPPLPHGCIHVVRGDLARHDPFAFVEHLDTDLAFETERLRSDDFLEESGGTGVLFNHGSLRSGESDDDGNSRVGDGENRVGEWIGLVDVEESVERDDSRVAELKRAETHPVTNTAAASSSCKVGAGPS